MSSIYFHSQRGEARVRGPERAKGCVYAQDLFRSMLPFNGDHLFEHEMEAWKAVTRPEDHARLFEPGDRLPAFRGHPPVPMWRHRLGLHLGGGLSGLDVLIQGEWEDSLDMALNTGYRWGSDGARLLVRLHGQCEGHAYVEGPQRKWLARLIKRGRRDHTLRPEMGWEEVADLLLARDDEPVVTSYSVTEQFPHLGMAVRGGYRGGQRFYDLPEATQWRYAMAGLRGDEHADWLRLRPGRGRGGWSGFLFGAGRDASDLHAAVWPLIQAGQEAKYERERAARDVPSALSSTRR